MTAHARRQAAAMKELEATQMWPSNYAPPMYHLYRKLGMRVRPPHYESFVRTLAGQGVCFAIFWGVFMWFFEWQGSDAPLQDVLLRALLAGLFFGTAMAAMCAYGRRKWQLSRWEDL